MPRSRARDQLTTKHRDARLRIESDFRYLNGFFRFPPARSQEKDMKNPNTQRRSIGLLVAFATVLTLLAIWNLPEAEES